MTNINLGISPRQFCALIGITTQTLNKWNQQGCAPQFVRVSPRISRLPLARLREWLLARGFDSDIVEQMLADASALPFT
jgi:hypothetical protein